LRLVNKLIAKQDIAQTAMTEGMIHLTISAI
jgi:hypothetical protein